MRVYDIKKGTFRASLLAEESSLFSFYGEAIHEQNELRSSEKPRRGDFANELSVCVCTKPSAKQTIEHRRCGFASLHRFLCTALDAELSFILCTAFRAEPLHFHRFFRFLGTTFRTELTTVFCTTAADPFTCCRCALLRSRSCLLRLGLGLLLGSHVK